MGQYDIKIKRKSKQLLWLLMALFCVVFSSAIKKVIQLRADQKLSLHMHHDTDGSRLLTQNIKDGSREKHEIQAMVSPAKQTTPLPGFVPSFYALICNAFTEQLDLFTRISSRNSYNNRVVAASGSSLPLYIFTRNLRV